MKNVKMNGKIFPTVTASELATMCNVSTVYIRKLQERDILPLPNIRGKSKYHKNGDEIPGTRRYSITLAEKLKLIFSEFKSGTAITPEQKRRINIAFQQEVQFINEKPTNPII